MSCEICKRNAPGEFPPACSEARTRAAKDNPRQPNEEGTPYCARLADVTARYCGQFTVVRQQRRPA